MTAPIRQNNAGNTGFFLILLKQDQGDFTPFYQSTPLGAIVQNQRFRHDELPGSPEFLIHHFRKR
jgi:hypothetical protein